MTQMQQVKLSMILSRYNEAADRLNIVPESIEDKLHILLYALCEVLHISCLGYSFINISDDCEMNFPSIQGLSDADFEILSSMLSTYGVNLSSKNTTEQETQKVLVVPSQIVETWLEYNELNEVASQIEEYLKMVLKPVLENEMELSLPDSILIIPDATSKNTESLYALFNSKCPIIELWNPFTRFYEEALSTVRLLDGNIKPINGYTQISVNNTDEYLWWKLCCYGLGGRPYTEHLSLIQYCLDQDTELLIFDSAGTLVGSNKEAQNKYAFPGLKATVVPNDVLHSLALLQLLSGKQVEFVNYPRSVTNNYAEILSDTMLALDEDIRHRLQAFKEVRLGASYVTPYNFEFFPGVLRKKSYTFHWQAFDLSYLTNHIIPVPTTAKSSAEYKFILSASMTDFTMPETLTDADVDLVNNQKVEILSIYDVLAESLVKTLNPVTLRDPVAASQYANGYAYEALRFIEQKLLKYSKVLNIADLIAFKYEDKIYIGAAEFKAHFDMDVFIYTNNLMEIAVTTDRLLPITTFELDEDMQSLLANAPELRYSSEDTGEFVTIQDLYEGIFAKHFTTIDIQDIYGDTFFKRQTLQEQLSSYYRLNTKTFVNSSIRRNSWQQYCKNIKSFGLRNLDCGESPFTIFGGITSGGNSKIPLNPVILADIPKGV